MAQHIVKAYDKDLHYLTQKIENMGEDVKSQLSKAIKALVEKDEELARQVIEADPAIDAQDHEIDTYAIRTIALRQPVADDLRMIVTTLKIASHLERIADYARNIARRSLSLDGVVKHISLQAIYRMEEITIEMIGDVLNAFINKNDEIAQAVWHRDVQLDEIYTSFLRELLTYMMEDPRHIGPCTQLLFIAKNIERIGDHTTNIAEMVHYMVHGKPFEEPRPRGMPL
jgi:phosphate transport system protein